jgi:hypothetical protein
MVVEVDVVEISGFVSDENPQSTSVSFSGIAVGSAAVNSDGYFYFRSSFTELGNVNVVVTDNEGLSSAASSVTIQNSAPYLNYLYAYPTGAGKEVMVSGQANDDFLAGNVIVLSGVVEGAIAVDSMGYFSATLVAAGVGTISAQATDYWGATSSVMETSINVSPPSFTAQAYESGAGRELTISASIYDGLYGDPGTASLSGIASASAAIDSSGQATIICQASGEGDLEVQVTNSWGLSATQTIYVASQAPTVSNLSAVFLGNDMYQISGSVSDEWAEGLTVQIGGALGAHSASVSASGAFEVVVSGPPGLQGNVQAAVIDWWGLHSNDEFTSLV